MRHSVLIADDDRSTRVLLERTLTKMGLEVVCRDNGTDADIVLQRENPPHLAILDWEMPGLTGLEVCENLRTRCNHSYTYVILLTSRQDKAEISKAFSAGVDDFITKPFNTNILSQRLAVGTRVVENERQLLNKQRELAQMVEKLEGMAEQKAQQLVHTERLATLGTLAAGVAHEINNPSTFISGNIKILEECWPIMDRALGCYGGDPKADPAQLEFIREETPKIINGIQEGVARIRKIVDGLKTYSREGGEQWKPFDLSARIENALTICNNLLKYNITVEREIPASPVFVLGDMQEIEQVFINLISNAADAMKEQKSGTLAIGITFQQNRVKVEVRDTGPGMPDKVLDKIWQPFFTTKEPGKGTGLGMPIVQRIIRNHQGHIDAANHDEGGAVFHIDLPLVNDGKPPSVKESELESGRQLLQRIGP